jgi:hypothetical protein
MQRKFLFQRVPSNQPLLRNYALQLLLELHKELNLFNFFFYDKQLITVDSKNYIIQGVFESCAEILTTSYWLHVELGKNI